MAQRIGGRTGRMLDALGYYRKITQIGHGTAYTQVRTLWGIPGISRPVKYECEGGIRQIQLLKNPEIPIGTLKRMIKAIISGKAKIERGEVPEAEEAFSDIEARHPEIKGLIQEARNKLSRESAPPPITPPPALDDIEEAVEPADAPSVARKAAPPPPPAEEEVPEEDVPVLDVCQVSRLEVLEEPDNADTAETYTPPPVKKEADTERFQAPPVDDEAQTEIWQATPGNDRTMIMNPQQKRKFFDSITRIITVGSQAFKAVKEVVESGDNPELVSVFERLTEQVDMYRKMADDLSARVGGLETEVAKLKAEKESLTGEILDELAAKFPSLAKKANALKAILS